MKRLALLAVLALAASAPAASAQVMGPDKGSAKNPIDSAEDNAKVPEIVPAPTKLDPFQVADALGGPCDAAPVAALKARAAKFNCTAGKVVKVIRDDGSFYTLPTIPKGQEGYDPDYKYVAVTMSALNSGTGCHNADPMVLFAHGFSPTYADTSSPYIFQKADGTGRELDNYKVNMGSFTAQGPSSFLTWNMNSGTQGLQTQAVIQGAMELTDRDWNGLRNGWCDYSLFPANNGWYQNGGTIDPSAQSLATESGSGGGYTGSTTAQASLLPSCYRGYSSQQSPDSVADGQNTIQAALPGGWVSGGAVCDAGFQNYIGIMTFLMGVPNDDTLDCNGAQHAFCAVRMMEWDIIVRTGSINGQRIAFCLESQPYCNGSYSNGLLAIFPLEELLRHERGHGKGLDHESGNIQGDLMGPSINQVGNGNGVSDRIGCNEAKYQNDQHKPFNSTDNPYPIFNGAARC